MRPGPRESKPQRLLPRSWRRSVIVGATLCFVGLLGTFASAQGERPSLLLATTTSVRDSGLLDALLPEFTRRTGIDVRVIAVGTGAALRMGREGNADVLLTHAPPAEEAMVAEGVLTRRTPFMQNDFVIAGPPEDPAGVADAKDPIEALRRIHSKRARWVSRDDDSGTNKREKHLFAKAGIDPSAGWEGFDRTGSGMGLSLQVAGERRAYILSDIGTFLAYRQRVDLIDLSKPSEELRNVYSVLQLDATRFDRPLATAEAERFEQFLLEPDTLDRIGRFGIERYGRALFTPLRSPAPSTGAARPEPSPSPE